MKWYGSWWQYGGWSLTSLWGMTPNGLRSLRLLSDETWKFSKGIDMREWTWKVESRPIIKCEALGRWGFQIHQFSAWGTEWIWVPLIEVQMGGGVLRVCKSCALAISGGILQLKREIEARLRFWFPSPRWVIFVNMELVEFAW